MIVLPVPPSTNHLFVNVKGKGRVRSKEYTAWAIRAGLHLKTQNIEPMTGPVGITMALPKAVRGDIDNRIKAPLDLLVTFGIIEDDRFVQSILIYRYPGEVMQVEIHSA